MCKAFQDAIEEGRVKGHAEGRVEAIKSLMVNLKFTAEQAMDALSIPKSEQEKYLSLI